MPLKVNDIVNMMQRYAPVELKESYDNVGLMVGDNNCEVTKILIALDCTLKVIDEAIECGCNMIITHHPLLFRKPANITMDTLQGEKIIKLIKNNINLYSSHTNLDITPKGVTETIMKILGFSESYPIEPSQVDSQVGIGRIVSLEESSTLEELINKVKEKLNIGMLRYCGDEGKIINKVAVINGSGGKHIEMAVKEGADCIITGDTTYHYMSDYNEYGIAIIDAGHFDTEWPAMKAVAKVINQGLTLLDVNYCVIMSKNTTNPYKFN